MKKVVSMHAFADSDTAVS